MSTDDLVDFDVMHLIKKESFRKELRFFKILFERYYGGGYKRHESNDALRTATRTFISGTGCV